MKAYARYPTERLEQRFGIDNFYVLTLLPSATEVKNFIGKLAKEGGVLASRKFWASDYGALQRIGEKVFRVPDGGECSVWEA